MTEEQIYFKDPSKPEMYELVKYFQIEFKELADQMKESQHSLDGVPNKFHLEDSVWTHTMLVCQRAEIDNASKINKICALLHDIGKPLAREVSEEKQRARFLGHEGLSFYLSIDILNDLEKRNVINTKEKHMCLTIISRHGQLFDRIKDSKMYKPENVFSSFVSTIKISNYNKNITIKEYFKDEIDTYNQYIKQVKYDSLGRFYTPIDLVENKPDRSNNAVLLGKELYSEEHLIQYIEEQLKVKQSDKYSSPYLEVLVGVPNSGKSTYIRDIKNNLKNTVIISRDNILMDYAKDINIIGDYNFVWNYLEDEDHKNIDKLLEQKFQKAVKNRSNIIIDMTNTSPKRQRAWCNKVHKDYYKVSKVFCTSYSTIMNRNSLRAGKIINPGIIINMMKSFSTSTYTEFDAIEYI